MKINYLVLAHENLSQVDRLISVLRGEDVRFFVHIDKKVAAGQIRNALFYKDERVRISRKRFDVRWGGFNMVRATLNLMKMAVQLGEPGYGILVSGADFPLQPMETIRSFFERNSGKEYLDYAAFPHPGWAGGGYDRIRYYWFVDQLGINESRRLAQLQHDSGQMRPYFEDFRPFGGSQWWCLTSGCMEYILKFVRHNPVYTDFYALAHVPDEMFFQTIVLNSPFRDHVVNDNLRYIVFNGNSAHPRVLGECDYNALTASECLWARKFDDRVDKEILQKLEERVYGCDRFTASNTH